MSEVLRYETKLEAFEGPLDLLLHLIKESKLDIHEIKISEITGQYLAYIKAMEELHLEVASEYLVMAANLTLIKSKKLLPKEESSLEDEYEEDPEAALIRRLLEYQLYKGSLDEFRRLEEERGRFYTKPPIDFSEYIDEHLQLDLNYDVSELILAFEKLLRRKKLEMPIETTIVTEKVTVSSRIDAIKSKLKMKGQIKFSQLFERYDKSYVVVTFLAMLEMAKTRELTLIKNNCEDEIEITSKRWLN